MIGRVDVSARALLSLQLRQSEVSDAQELVVWIDTAFDGELVVPAADVQRLGLPQSSTCQAILANGTTVTLETYYCWIDWFGSYRRVEVVTSNARLPLLGTALLRKHKLTVDYRSGEVTLE
jgi:clan AA aspartic protease